MSYKSFCCLDGQSPQRPEMIPSNGLLGTFVLFSTVPYLTKLHTEFFCHCDYAVITDLEFSRNPRISAFWALGLFFSTMFYRSRMYLRRAVASLNSSLKKGRMVIFEISLSGIKTGSGQRMMIFFHWYSVELDETESPEGLLFTKSSRSKGKGIRDHILSDKLWFTICYLHSHFWTVFSFFPPYLYES